MIVLDTSAFVTLATGDVLRLVLEEFDVHTTETVVRELEDAAGYDDVHGESARSVIDQLDRVIVHEASERTFQSSRVDEGEGSCAILALGEDVDFLITDDLGALPELRTLAGTRVAISPIVLKALVQRGVLGREDAIETLDRMAEDRSWIGRPIYRRVRRLFDE